MAITSVRSYCIQKFTLKDQSTSIFVHWIINKRLYKNYSKYFISRFFVSPKIFKCEVRDFLPYVYLETYWYKICIRNIEVRIIK